MNLKPIKVESESFGEFALFPDESGMGVQISHSEMKELSIFYSKLYEIYIAKLSPELANHFEISQSTSNLLVRQAFVPIFFCFMDRLVRLNKLIKRFPNKFVLSNKVNSYKFHLIEDFQDASANSPHFNQYLIWFIGRIWNINESNLDLKYKVFDTIQPGYKNNLFRIYRRTPLRIIRKLLMSLLSYKNKFKFPTLSLSNSKWALHHHGFYVNYLKEIKFSANNNNFDKNENLRKKLFSDDLFFTPELDDFIDKLNFKSSEKKSFYSLLKDFFRLHYPVSLLEGIPENINSAKEALNFFDMPALMSSGGITTSSAYIFAIAKDNGTCIVDFQHGGYYGYIEDWSMVNELEYSGIDEFVSWGWSNISRKFINNSLNVTNLPSPWLSERKKYWNKIRVTSDKKYDFLYMSTKIKRFPDAPHGALLSRDAIKTTSKDIVALVEIMAKNEFSILHKPCDMSSIQLLSKTMEDLIRVGKERYTVIKKIDKGLTYELLNDCSMVLWDQPGTGFLECLSAGIPCMLNWTRVSSTENVFAKPYFQALESCGIIHRNGESLVTEMKKFKTSPELWMHDSERTKKINMFCQQFASTDKNWPKYWREFFEQKKLSL